MIGYVTLGTNNFEKAAAFYDSLLGSMGAGRFLESDSFIAWAVSPEQPALSIIKPYDGEDACIGNGVMVALLADSTEKVDELYNKAISLGATDEGKPGLRSEGGIYVGYFRDLDGNKLNFFCIPS